MQIEIRETGAKIDEDSITIFGASPADASFTLPLALLPAMLTGGPLEISGNVSQRLVYSAPTIQNILRSWVPQTKASIRARPCRTPANSGSVALFFSAGADSLASLIRLHDSVTEVIAVQGFDIPISDTRGFDRCVERLQSTAQVLQKPLRVVKTNLREWSDTCFRRLRAWETISC